MVELEILAWFESSFLCFWKGEGKSLFSVRASCDLTFLSIIHHRSDYFSATWMHKSTTYCKQDKPIDYIKEVCRVLHNKHYKVLQETMLSDAPRESVTY